MSTITDDATLLVLHALRLSGFVPAERLARTTGLDDVTVAEVLRVSAEAGRATERTGRISGWTLTSEGRDVHARLLADELTRTGARSAVERADAAFVELNGPFKELCTRWQVRPDGTPNDHSDTGYDAAVVADLAPVHAGVVELTSALAGALPRYGRYPRAFAAALERLRAGDRKAFAAPLSESYHDTWMELHQDLMSTLGRTRSATDGH